MKKFIKEIFSAENLKYAVAAMSGGNQYNYLYLRDMKKNSAK